MEKSVRQKLMIPLFMCVGFVATGITSILRGIESHQTWRIVLAASSTALFAAGIVVILFAVHKERLGQKNS
jgi:hypothetical protein